MVFVTYGSQNREKRTLHKDTCSSREKQTPQGQTQLESYDQFRITPWLDPANTGGPRLTQRSKNSASPNHNQNASTPDTLRETRESRPGGGGTHHLQRNIHSRRRTRKTSPSNVRPPPHHHLLLVAHSQMTNLVINAQLVSHHWHPSPAFISVAKSKQSWRESTFSYNPRYHCSPRPRFHCPHRARTVV